MRATAERLEGPPDSRAPGATIDRKIICEILGRREGTE